MFCKPTEKRKYQRFLLSVPLQYRYSVKINNALLYDIGRGGLKFTTTDFIPVNTSLTAVILMKEEPLKVDGEIAWVCKVPFGDRYMIGLRFREVSQRVAERIDNLENTLLVQKF